MRGKCGEEYGQFYDRKGDYFRKGVDPRNHYGRFVHHFDNCHLKPVPDTAKNIADAFDEEALKTLIHRNLREADKAFERAIDTDILAKLVKCNG